MYKSTVRGAFIAFGLTASGAAGGAVGGAAVMDFVNSHEQAESAPTITEVPTTEVSAAPAPVNPFDVFTTGPDTFYSPEYGDLNPTTCAALALQYVLLGPEGLPPADLFGETTPDGTLHVYGESYISSRDLADSSDAIMTALTGPDGLGIPVDSNTGEVLPSTADAIAAASTAEAAISSLDTFYSLPNEEILAPEAMNDAAGMIVQAYDATVAALNAGCKYLIGHTINS